MSRLFSLIFSLILSWGILFSLNYCGGSDGGGNGSPPSDTQSPPDDGDPPDPKTDDHGNTQARATPVTSGTAVAGNIETGDDQDYFSIAVTRAGTLRATTTDGTNTVGHLYNSGGTELARDNEDGADTNFDISYNVTSAGIYYVRVTSSGTNTGTYSLSVTFTAAPDTPGPPSDDHSNMQRDATIVTSGTAVAGNIETGDDQDYFSIAVTRAGTLRATTTDGTNTVGHLYNRGGTELARDNEDGADTNFDISYDVTNADTYYIRVTSSGTNTGTYSLTVTFTAAPDPPGPPSDDHGNTQARATPVTSGTAVAGNIETGDDQDYFSIAVTRAGTLRATTTDGTNTVGHLYNSGGTELARDNEDGADTNFDISYDVTSAGTYYVRVTSSGTNTGTYSLTVTFTAAPDPPDITFMYPELNYSSCGGSIQINPALTTDLDLARISFTISPELPSGIQISSATGEISGIYSNYHSQSYVVKVLVDGTEQTRTDLNIKINAVEQISYPQEIYQFTTNTAITLATNISPSHSGAVFSVSPALPTGLSLNSSTGGVTGNLASELGNQDHTVQVVSGECQKQIPLSFCANQDGNCPPRFLSDQNIHYADVADAVFPTDATVNEIIKGDKKSVGDHLESRYIGIEVKSFVDDNEDPFTIEIVSQTNNNSHPRRTGNPYSYKYRERSIDPAGRNKVRKLYFFDSNLPAPPSPGSLTDIELHRFHKFTTDTLTLRATDGNGRSTTGTIEIRRSPKLKDCTGLTGEALNECTWLSEILPGGWKDNTLSDAVKNKLPNLTQNKDNYRLVFAEEFNGDGDSDYHNLDRSKWRLQGWAGWENNPDANRDDCFFQIKDGTLQMSYLFNCTDKVVALHTLGILEYKYGYIEMKFKIPLNQPHSSASEASMNRNFYSNYAGVLWGRYANKYYHTTPPVLVNSIEKYLKYQIVEWDLYEFVPRPASNSNKNAFFSHWYYTQAKAEGDGTFNDGDTTKFLIPVKQIDYINVLCRRQLNPSSDPDPITTAREAKIEEEAKRGRVYLEGCGSAVAATAADAPSKDKFITLTRGWEWTPKGYRVFSSYEKTNDDDETRYGTDLFPDSLKPRHWTNYGIKYQPYTNTSTFSRSGSNKQLRREAPYITSRDDEDQLLEIGVFHQPTILELVVWGREGSLGSIEYVTPPSNTVHPHVFHIDYVRVYKPVDNYSGVTPSYRWAPNDDQSACSEGVTDC